MATQNQTPDLPPEIRGQMQPPEAPAMMQAGQAQAGQPGGSAGDPIGQLDQKVGELEKWAQDVMMLCDQVHKPLGALLVPIAKAGAALKQEVERIKQQKSKGAGASPAGPPPPGNPGEGVPQRQAA